MPIYSYNYPWSGRLGRIAECCLYCGRTDSSWVYSSHGDRCLHRECPSRKPDAVPIPELMAEFHKRYEQLAREWCRVHRIGYEETIENYLKHCGPLNQERSTPIPQAGHDWTVFLKEDGGREGG